MNRVPGCPLEVAAEKEFPHGLHNPVNNCNLSPFNAFSVAKVCHNKRRIWLNILTSFEYIGFFLATHFMTQ